jgi:hypothetical protein
LYHLVLKAAFSLGLDQGALERKMKLVALMSLTSTKVGKELTYAEISKTISVPEKEVENWVIQGNVRSTNCFIPPPTPQSNVARTPQTFVSFQRYTGSWFSD